MEYIENITGIKINVQAVDITIGDDVKETIRKSITRLSRVYKKI
jgi:putative sigma-54 modulation protein